MSATFAPAPIEALAAARRRTDELFALVPEQSLLERPIPERHRLAFYLGHLEAFDVNLLVQAGAPQPRARAPAARAVAAAQRTGREAPSDASLDALFAFGIDPLDKQQLPADRPEDWPAPDQIRDYARRARARVDRRLGDQPQAGSTERIQAAIEHRWMHAETLAYLLNRLPAPRPLRPLPASAGRLGDGERCRVPAGIATLGAAEGQYGWDNEQPRCTQAVPAFIIDRYMVTNGQFLRFVEAGGYSTPRWWTAQDWRWRASVDLQHPASWRRLDGAWVLQSRLDLVRFQGDWPVYVSHAEASAYASWAGAQLPTEAQWQHAAYGGAGDDGQGRRYPWGDAQPCARLGNFDFQRWDPLPVDACAEGASAFGVVGMLGNGWEWTRTPFAPFPGFQPRPFYPGYSADFFDGRHFVLKGGSAHTARRLLRRSFRNWYQARYPYACAGFRCVRPS